MFHLPCINQVHNIQITNKFTSKFMMYFNNNFLRRHVSAAIAAIFMVITKIQRYNMVSCVVVSP